MELVFGGGDIKAAEIPKMMEEAAALVLKREGILNDEVEISVTFYDDNDIRELNRDYRGIDKVTDVLSFPQYERPEEIPEEGFVPIGDVVINIDQALRQAEEYGHSTEREIIYLFVHSMLHLLGYDHMEEDEKTEMRKAEEEIMNELNLVR